MQHLRMQELQLRKRRGRVFKAFISLCKLLLCFHCHMHSPSLGLVYVAVVGMESQNPATNQNSLITIYWLKNELIPFCLLNGPQISAISGLRALNEKLNSATALILGHGPVYCHKSELNWTELKSEPEFVFYWYLNKR